MSRRRAFAAAPPAASGIPRSPMPDDRSPTRLLSDRYNAAFELASEVHAHQRRKGTPISYLAHVMSVSALVMENGGDEDSDIAGLLHDAVEDSTDGDAMLAHLRWR